eukprot:3546424-Pyramimonas_sp.AAC.1
MALVSHSTTGEFNPSPNYSCRRLNVRVDVKSVRTLSQGLSVCVDVTAQAALQRRRLNKGLVSVL